MNLDYIIAKLNEITAINQRLGVIREDRSISDSIANNKKYIEDLKKSVEDVKTVNDAVKDDFPKIAERLDKIKIPHPKKDINNIVYTVKYGTIDWVNGNLNLFYPPLDINGIYGFTIISDEQFNLIGVNPDNMMKEFNNVITFKYTREVNSPFTLTAVNDLTVRKTISQMIELVADLSSN